MLGIEEIAGSDQHLKNLFDHVRNLGIAAAVLGAGVWRFNHLVDSGFEHYLQTTQAALAFSMGIWLYGINMYHGGQKLADAAVSHAKRQAASLVYSICTVPMIYSLLARSLGYRRTRRRCSSMRRWRGDTAPAVGPRGDPNQPSARGSHP